ncbi:MAG: pteridine reductase [Betaproteobacteria bacterium]|jgi:pteridine reductase|nr:pteridine reductase [Rhodocyclaceae bacterium]MCA3134107.1 pteridine reductase [Rhodocyclaceae bacterium]MCA3142601.1 pteridine reductase [Rhodocyclaceae bacterium]MCA3144350.1 pteridine reductase [Rhodocyclaceae bacterium]MCE2897414.1 pteridine reductase [Betaproteobacteria bacterium]
MQNRVVLITGGARRVGAAICRRLHAEGASLMIHYRRSMAEARALQAELNAIRADSVALAQADLLNMAHLPALVNDTVQRFERLDVLVNNASSFHATPVGEIDESDWDDLVGTNLKTPLFLSQAAAPHLRRAEGCIVNIVDIHVERPLKNYLVYNAAKGGLVALTRSLARELGPEIRVNGVAPGPILWPEDETWSDELARQRIVNTTLLKRTGEPDDIARAVRFLVCDAPYVTGQILNVDGGRSVHL